MPLQIDKAFSAIKNCLKVKLVQKLANAMRINAKLLQIKIDENQSCDCLALKMQWTTFKFTKLDNIF